MRLSLLPGLAASGLLLTMDPGRAAIDQAAFDVWGKLPRKMSLVKQNNPGETVDLGVGLWASPIPCDRNGDGKPDLVVVGSGLINGVYYFENTGRKDPKTGADLFRAGERMSGSLLNTYFTPSYTKEGIRVMSPGVEYADFLTSGMQKPMPLKVDESISALQGRGNQWSYVDYNHDGILDLVVALGDWRAYGAEMGNGYDQYGRWISGPLHGWVYVAENKGTNREPQYEAPRKVQAGGIPLDVYGTPSPVFGDFCGTGRMDLICGEFMDGFTFFENTGTPEEPKFSRGLRLRDANDRPLNMPLEMIIVTAFDWNNDGRLDLVVGQEDGRVAWLENTGKIREIKGPKGEVMARAPEFKTPQFFRQEADDLKYGVLTTPVSCDWDHDGDEDIVTGNSAGELAWIKNLGGNPPKWSEPIPLMAEGKPIREIAGDSGSIQGPSETKWGYSNVGVGDWDGDGLEDVLASYIQGKIVWYKNIGTKSEPKLAAAQPVKVAWPGAPPKPAWNWWNPQPGELVVEWRCTPLVIDLDHDGINDLVSVDHEGYLAFYRQVERDGKRVLLPGERIFQRKEGGKIAPLQLNTEALGRSGRKTYCFTDWDGDGKPDLLVNEYNFVLYRNVSTKPGEWVFEKKGAIDGLRLQGHSCAPTTVDWDGDKLPDLLAGDENGFFYLLRNPRSAGER